MATARSRRPGSILPKGARRRRSICTGRDMRRMKVATYVRRPTRLETAHESARRSLLLEIYAAVCFHRPMLLLRTLPAAAGHHEPSPDASRRRWTLHVAVRRRFLAHAVWHPRSAALRDGCRRGGDGPAAVVDRRRQRRGGRRSWWGGR